MSADAASYGDDERVMPAADYACGAAHCDDPACNTHGSKDGDGRLLYHVAHPDHYAELVVMDNEDDEYKPSAAMAEAVKRLASVREDMASVVAEFSTKPVIRDQMIRVDLDSATAQSGIPNAPSVRAIPAVTAEEIAEILAARVPWYDMMRYAPYADAMAVAGLLVIIGVFATLNWRFAAIVAGVLLVGIAVALGRGKR